MQPKAAMWCHYRQDSVLPVLHRLETMCDEIERGDKSAESTIKVVMALLKLADAEAETSIENASSIVTSARRAAGMPARSTTCENNALLRARFFAIEVERSNAVKEQIADAMVAVGLESQDLSKPANIPPGQWRSQNAARTRAVADHESSHAIIGASMGLQIGFVTVALSGRSGLCAYVDQPTAPQMLRLSLAGLVANVGRGQGIFGVSSEGGDIEKAQSALLELTGRHVPADAVLNDSYVDDFRSEVANFLDEHNSVIGELAAELVANLGLRVDGSVVHEIWNRRAEKVRQMQTA